MVNNPLNEVNAIEMQNNPLNEVNAIEMNNNPLNVVNATEFNNNPCIYMPKLAHAYVPFQCMTDIYPPMVGLNQGTIFPELDSPYGVDPEYIFDA